MDSRYYPGVEADVSKLVAELRNIFDEDYEVQTMHAASTTIVQARKSSTLRDLTGLSAALTIKITPEAGGTRVEIGMQKWLDKAAIAAVAVLLSAGMLLALPALGAYWQYRVTEDAWKAIEEHLARQADTCRRCRAVAAIAARQTPPAQNSVQHAAPTSRVAPARRAARRKRIRQRVFVTSAGRGWRPTLDAGL